MDPVHIPPVHCINRLPCMQPSSSSVIPVSQASPGSAVKSSGQESGRSGRAALSLHFLAGVESQAVRASSAIRREVFFMGLSFLEGWEFEA